MPENLPTPEKSIQELQREEQKRIAVELQREEQKRIAAERQPSLFDQLDE